MVNTAKNQKEDYLSNANVTSQIPCTTLLAMKHTIGYSLMKSELISHMY